MEMNSIEHRVNDMRDKIYTHEANIDQQLVEINLLAQACIILLMQHPDTPFGSLTLRTLSGKYPKAREDAEMALAQDHDDTLELERDLDN